MFLTHGRMAVPRKIAVCLCWGWLCCLSVAAQTGGASISGIVTDPAGAVLVGASITTRNLDNGLVRQGLTDSRGYYHFLTLPGGRYEMRAEYKDFDPQTRPNLTLTVGQEAVVDFQLKLQSVADEVTIQADAPEVSRTSSALSGLVGEKKIRDLPLNGRDLAQLVLLQPGVVWTRSSVVSAVDGRGTRFSVAGARPSDNLFVLDGTIVNDAPNTTPGSAQGLLVGVETVKEFRILTNTYSAEYGRASGGVFVAVTRSGSNDRHGSLFNFLRDDKLDARNFFDRDKPDFRRNQFGFALGGPIRKNHTFVFGSYEGLREHKGITRIAIVPDDQARTGLLPGRPPIAIDPRSQPIIDLFPKANGRAFGDGTAEFLGTTNRISRDDFFSVRLDHGISAADSLFVRYLFDDSYQVLPRNYPQFPNEAVNRRQVLTIGEQKSISATLVNEIRIGLNRSTPAEWVPTPATALQLIVGRDLGEVNVTGLTEIGTERNNPKAYFLNDFQVADDLLRTLGRHQLKIGGLLERLQYNGRSESRTRGQLRFRSLADLLLFRVQDLQGAAAGADFVRGFRQTLAAVYLHDDIRLRRRVTFNVGLRYETVTAPHEVNGKVSNLRDVLDPEMTLGDPLFEPPRNSLAPRLGLAYDVLGDGKTVVRSGFGVFHEQPLFHLYRNTVFRTLPFVNRGRLKASDFSSLPVDPELFKGVDQVTESVQFRLRPSYGLQYNLNLQRALPADTVLTLAYVGSRGINLIGTADLNTAIPVILADGRTFFPEGSRRRNPEFDVIRGVFQGVTSSYHAFWTGVTKRFGQGLQFQGSYTLGKSIDDASGTGRMSWANGQARVLDPYYRQLDRARSNFDIRHSFRANATYELPRPHAWKGWAGRLSGGWQLNAVVSLYSGVPFTPSVSGDPDRDASEENFARPDLVPGMSFTPAAGRSVDLWFNPAAFAAPQPGFRGTAGRNILEGPDYQSVDLSIVRSIHLTEHEEVQLRIEVFNLLNRANFDLPSNTEDGEQIFTYFPASSDSLASFDPTPGVGRISNTSGDSREIQLGLKFIF